jgi:hypothetical protein
MIHELSISAEVVEDSRCLLKLVCGESQEFGNSIIINFILKIHASQTPIIKWLNKAELIYTR